MTRRERRIYTLLLIFPTAGFLVYLRSMRTLLYLVLALSSLQALATPRLLEERRLTLARLKAVYQELESVRPAVLPASFAPTHRTDIQVIVLKNNSWTTTRVWQRITRAAAVFLQCGLHIDKVKLFEAHPRGFDQARSNMNVLTDPVGNDQVARIGRALTSANLLGPATIIYIEEQTKTLAGVSFPSAMGGRFRNRPVPFRDVDLAFIPYIYEESQHLVPEYISADYLGEAHELGHLLGLTHQNLSPLMHVDPIDVATGVARQQNNELYGSACVTVKRSHLVEALPAVR